METAELPFADPKEAAAAPATEVALAAAALAPLEPPTLNVGQYLTTGLQSHEPLLRALAAKHATAPLDVSTPAGLADAKARRHELRELGRYKINRLVDAIKKDLNGAKPLVEAEGQRLVQLVYPTETRFDNAITAEETRREQERQAAIQREAERKERHGAAVRKILGYVSQAAGLPAERIAKGITALEGMTFGAEWEEFAAEAAAARDDALAGLRRMHAQALEHEKLLAERPTVQTGGLVADASTGEILNTVATVATPPAPPPATESAGAQAREAVTPAADAPLAGSPAAPAPQPAPTPDQPGYYTGIVGHAAPAEDATVTLGDLCERLGFTINADFLRNTLKVPTVPGKGRTVLVAVKDLPEVRRALLIHVQGVKLA